MSTDPADMTPERSAVVERTCRLLRALGQHGQAGARLVDLTQATGMTRPAVLRILRALIAEGFVLHGGRLYRLGAEVFQLGLAAQNPLGDMTAIRRIVRDLAADVGDTIYLCMRQGDHAVYLLREEGAFPVRTHNVSVGDAKPLTETYGGITLLFSMPQEERRATLDRLLPASDPASPQRRAVIEGMLARSDACGYVAGADLVLRGVAGIGLPIAAPSTGVAFLSLTVSAITPRLEDDRLEAVCARLGRAVGEIAAYLAEPSAQD